MQVGLTLIQCNEEFVLSTRMDFSFKSTRTRTLDPLVLSRLNYGWLMIIYK
jgi:hypothetical protein